MKPNEPQPNRTDLAAVNPWPYPAREYLFRLLWKIAWLTLWQVFPKRIWPLRRLLLRCFGARIGRPAIFHRSTWIERPWDMRAGDYCAFGPRTTIYNLGPVAFGNRAVVSQDVYLCGGTHDYTRPDLPLVRSPIAVGSDVWITAGAFVGPGVTIGDGAVVGARAVVVEDVPAWTVVGGNPARAIKPRVISSGPQ